MDKNTQKIISRFPRYISLVGLILVLFIFFVAFFMQYYFKEDPCPLCLLQRAAFFNIGLALLLNLRYGNKVRHWAIMLLSASVGAAISIRQILLHVNDPVGYGSAVLGLHLYTWSFLGFAIGIMVGVIMLIVFECD